MAILLVGSVLFRDYSSLTNPVAYLLTTNRIVCDGPISLLRWTK